MMDGGTYEDMKMVVADGKHNKRPATLTVSTGCRI